MTAPIGKISGMNLSSEVRRPRTTPPSTSTFKAVLAEGAQVLLAGASAASGLVGGPLLSGAIQAARTRLAQATGQGYPGSGHAGQGYAGQGYAGQGGTQLMSGSAPGAPGTALAAAAPEGSAGLGGGTSEIEAMRQLQKEGQQHNVQYLMLQKDVQDENRRFNVASNLLKARHDTARAAVNNMRT